MTKLLVQNKKIKKSSDANYLVLNFGLPAYKSTTGLITCPLAGECGNAGGCYALQGPYRWSNVAQAYENRLQATLSNDFIINLQAELNGKLKTSKRQNKQIVIRIHDSGDFYSLDYTEKWLQIINNNPNVKFYAYTKMIPLFNLLKKQGKIPSNFRVIYSEGGKMDKLIKENDYHAKVFSSEKELIDAGYSNAMHNDLVAGLGENNKIGLVYHGAKSKLWTTN